MPERPDVLLPDRWCEFDRSSKILARLDADTFREAISSCGLLLYSYCLSPLSSLSALSPLCSI
ncbi:uncharacterized protein PHALS_03494 [Plasmopara halstedii]|uniref:Uncharacterized protein n=1 Tax=Plasmopara halstedii TaxID=4781 RepID=A0A0P1AXN5_PLAHL|nr:uncharacterized protein PHALS_03494 [Plasmopara halstedii]CEG46814.1 hypothetical protein PHALS_03494 [Plasmopara halstedii]|eukprot:XP_024583183.1 hypothetical protein PHALS_03494 [Plasmopara halstedii]